MKYLFLLFAFVSVAVFSCSKDDDNNSQPDNAKIVGTWNAQSVHTVIETKDDEEKFEETNTYEDDGGDYSTITFKSDGSYTAKSVADGQTESSRGTYSLKKGKLTVTPDDNNDGGPFDWYLLSSGTIDCRINGNKMVVSFQGSAASEGQQVGYTIEVRLLKA